MGNWFGTGHWCKQFDGISFTRFLHSKQWQIMGLIKRLVFHAGGGLFRYDEGYDPICGRNEFGSTISQGPQLSLDLCQCIAHEDRSGNLWFGTQSWVLVGLMEIRSPAFTRKRLSGPAVLSLSRIELEIFGLEYGRDYLSTNNTNVLTNFSSRKGSQMMHSYLKGRWSWNACANLFNNEDSNGTYGRDSDAGAWRISGDRLINYTTMHGLSSNAVTTIIKTE